MAEAKPVETAPDIILDVDFTPQGYKDTISALSGNATVKNGGLNVDSTSTDYATLIEAPLTIFFTVKVIPDSTTEKIMNTTGTVATLSATAGTVSMDVGSWSIFVNGVSGGTLVAGIENEIVVNSTGAFTYTAIELGKGLHGKMTQFTMYYSAKTADQSLNDYNNVRKVEYKSDEILRVDVRNGVLQNEYVDQVIGSTVPEVVNTSVEVVRDSTYAMFFDGADSKLDCGSYDDLTGDKSFIAWIKPYSFGETTAGRIFNNGKVDFFVNDANDTIGFSSNASLQVNSASNSIVLGLWHLAIVTRTSAGITNFYVNGILSGSADQGSGTPAAGTTNIIIGDRDADDRTFYGLIGNARIENGILSSAQAMQVYTSEVGYYE
jgi:hypothetical protein